MIDGARTKPLGKFHPNTANVYSQLTETDRWSKVFAFDEFNNTEMVISKPPWQTGDPQYFKPRPSHGYRLYANTNLVAAVLG